MKTYYASPKILTVYYEIWTLSASLLTIDFSGTSYDSIVSAFLLTMYMYM